MKLMSLCHMNISIGTAPIVCVILVLLNVLAQSDIATSLLGAVKLEKEIWFKKDFEPTHFKIFLFNQISFSRPSQ